MSSNPGELIDQAPMSPIQILAVSLCILLTALDGFDVLSIAFAAPGISAEWGIDRAALGIVLSMELIGMGVGSIFLGRFADKYGRKPVVLGSLVVMTFGMYLAAISQGVNDLSAYRFFTGLGIGGILATTNALVAECSNLKNRAMCVMLMVGGYPLGIVIGGIISGQLLQSYDWRSIFYFGAAVTSAILVLVWFLLPESVSFLASKRSENALHRINATLVKMGHVALAALPEITEKKTEQVEGVLSENYRRNTILLTLAYFFHMMAFYFFLKWVPKLVVDMGFSASAAGGVLVWANVGSVISCILIGLLTHKFPIKKLAIGLLAGSAIIVVIYGGGQPDLTKLSILAATTGFLTNGAITCLYALFAANYPTEMRASGTGFVIGLGRAGAASGPIVAGFLFTMGLSLQGVALFMGAGCLIAAVSIFLLNTEKLEFGR